MAGRSEPLVERSEEEEGNLLVQLLTQPKKRLSWPVVDCIRYHPSKVTQKRRNNLNQQLSCHHRNFLYGNLLKSLRTPSGREAADSWIVIKQHSCNATGAPTTELIKIGREGRARLILFGSL